MSEGSLVERLHRDVADRQPIDWAALLAELQAGGDASPELQKEVSLLQLLDEIGQANFTFQSGAFGEDEPPAPVAAPADDTLKAWGRYVLEEKVGRGGFGNVYRAWDPVLEMPVAIKILHPRYSQDRLKERLVQEGRALAQIRHPNVVRVLNVEQHGGRLGLVMEFLSGETMDAIVAAKGPMGEREASAIVEDVCRALAVVHAKDLIHRDVKARNIIREAGGRVVLMDFGAGLSARDTPEGGPVVGTPLYMAPETLTGAPATPASDVYSVGVLLFYLVTGRYPYEAGSLKEIRDAQMAQRGNALQALRPELPARFVKIVNRALAIDVQERYQTPEALLDGLKPLGEVPTSKWAVARTVGFVAVALFATIVLGGMLSSAAFNAAFLRSSFATESFGDWIVYGSKALFLPFLLSLFLVGVLGGAASLRRIILASSARLRAIDGRFATTARTLAGRLALTEPGIRAAWLLLVTTTLAGAIWWHWTPIWTLMPSDISTASPDVLSVLSPARTVYRTHYRMSLSVLIAANIAAWLLIARSAGPSQRLPATLVAMESAIVVLLVLSMQVPYRLLHDVEKRPVVEWRGERCWVMGERGTDVLLFCPRSTPRIHPVTRDRTTPAPSGGHPFEFFSAYAP